MKRQRAKILTTLTLMKLEQKLIQQNGGQYMRLWTRLIPKSLTPPLSILSENVKKSKQST